MDKLTIKELVDAVKGKLISSCNIESISKVSIDSRDTNLNTLFIPIIGENLDGHKFAMSAYNNGCRVFIKNRESELDIPLNDTTIIEVDNTENAIGDIAHYYRSKFSIPFVGITGSVGKTTTRDIVYSVLSSKFNTLKNERNFNNQIGVPLTLFNLTNKHECAVVEMGMSGFNEIEHLSNIVRPQIGVISNIGQSHIERLGSQLGIFKAKMEIAKNFDENSTLIINGDDESLKAIKKEKYKYTIKSFGFSTDCTIYCHSYTMNETNTTFKCKIDNDFIDFTIPTTGVHNIYNAMAAILVGETLNIPIDKIKKGLECFEVTGMRLEVENTDKFRIINDTYNASPDSMKAALDVLKMYKGRKVAILGDMFEMGNFAINGHKTVGAYTSDKTDILITIGDISKHISNEAILHGTNPNNVYHFTHKEDLRILDIILPGDTILIKASRGMKLETIVEEIKSL